MTTVTLKQLCDAIADAIETNVSEVQEVQRPDELSEGINSERLVQVYPVSWNQDSTGNIHQQTFGGRTRNQETIIHVDVYARQRASLADDMALTILLADALNNFFETQVKPYFAFEYIRAYAWRGERLQFEYGQALYVGVRYTLTLFTF